MRSLLAWLVALAAACSSGAESPIRRGAPRVQPPDGGTPPPGDTVAARSVEDSPLPIGSTTVDLDPPPAARAANERGLAALRAGRLDEAEASFDEALRLDAGHEGARYNRACTLARKGEPEAAARELHTVLLADLPRFGEIVERDADLASLRSSPAWAPIRALMPRVAAAYERALVDGVPVVAWARRLDPRDPFRAGTIVLQAGVYLSSSERFVPMTPPVSEHRSSAPSGAMLLDPASHRAMFLFGQYSTSDIDDANPSFEVFRIPSAESISQWTIPELTAEAEGAPHRFELAFTTGAVRYRIADTSRPPSSPWLPWQERSGTTDRRLDGPWEPAASLLAGDVDHVWIQPPPLPAGWTFRGSNLVGPSGSFRLGRGHGPGDFVPFSRWLVLSASGSHAIVATASSDEAAEVTSIRYAVTRVTVATGQIEELGRGAGWGTTVLGADGAMYVQMGDRVRRYATPDAPAYRELAPGLALQPPPP
jgi:hypothetical protein